MALTSIELELVGLAKAHHTVCQERRVREQNILIVQSMHHQQPTGPTAGRRVPVMGRGSSLQTQHHSSERAKQD